MATAGLVLAACSSTSGAHSSTVRPAASGSTAAPASAATITIQNFAFHPGTLTVKPGATVTVTNKDSVTHTVTSTSGAFNTGDIPGGTTTHFTAPAKAGTYPYRCTIHQYMTATLVVS